MARIDVSSGKTIWAKAVFVGLTAQQYQFLPNSSLILNDDNTWVKILFYLTKIVLIYLIDFKFLYLLI